MSPRVQQFPMNINKFLFQMQVKKGLTKEKFKNNYYELSINELFNTNLYPIFCLIFFNTLGLIITILNKTLAKSK